MHARTRTMHPRKPSTSCPLPTSPWHPIAAVRAPQAAPQAVLQPAAGISLASDTTLGGWYSTQSVVQHTLSGTAHSQWCSTLSVVQHTLSGATHSQWYTTRGSLHSPPGPLLQARLYVRHTLPLAQARAALMSKDSEAAVVVDDNFTPMGLVFVEDIEAELVKQQLLLETDNNFDRPN
jgi:hypothetical protein